MFEKGLSLAITCQMEAFFTQLTVRQTQGMHSRVSRCHSPSHAMGVCRKLGLSAMMNAVKKTMARKKHSQEKSASMLKPALYARKPASGGAAASSINPAAEL